MFTDFDEMDIEPKSELPPRKSPPFEMDTATKVIIIIGFVVF